MEIRPLQESDAQAWWTLRLEGLRGFPFAFGKSVEEHLALPLETVAARFRDPAPGSFTLGAFEDGALIGMMTFMRDTGVKDRHKGHIYGVYVSPNYQAKGMGRALMTALLERATHDPSLEQILLAVATVQPVARRLYASFGFETVGIEPRALKVDSTYIDEENMILWLRRNNP